MKTVYEGKKLDLLAKLFELHEISATKEELQEAYDNIKRFICLLAEIKIQNLKNDASGRTLHPEN